MLASLPDVLASLPDVLASLPYVLRRLRGVDRKLQEQAEHCDAQPTAPGDAQPTWFLEPHQRASYRALAIFLEGTA